MPTNLKAIVSYAKCTHNRQISARELLTYLIIEDIEIIGRQIIAGPIKFIMISIDS